jgi:hypothetical protein
MIFQVWDKHVNNFTTDESNPVIHDVPLNNDLPCSKQACIHDLLLKPLSGFEKSMLIITLPRGESCAEIHLLVFKPQSSTLETDMITISPAIWSCPINPLSTI